MRNHNKKLYVLSAIIFLGIVAIIFSNAPTSYVVVEPVQQVENVALAKKSAEINESGKKVPVELKELEPEVKTESKVEENLITASIITGEVTTKISFAPGTIFYDALIEARAERQISFDGKNYPGLGFFVTDIETLHAGDGKDLLYYVNGKEANVGVSAYTLKDGDVIEWKLE